MAKNKIKRGKDWIDADLLSDKVKLGWNNYISDYNFGDIDFNKMLTLRDIILNYLRNNLLNYRNNEGTSYLFNLAENIPELMDGSNETKYALGFIGLNLLDLEAILEDPWNAVSYHNELLKNGYFNGQEPDVSLLAKLEQDLKITPYKTIINSFISGIDNVPEDKREDYLNFYNRSLGFMDDGEITNDELLELIRYTGNNWNWVNKPIAPIEISQEDLTKEKIEKKENTSNYIIHASFDRVNKDKVLEYYSIVSLMNLDDFIKSLKTSLNSPDEYPNLLAACIMYMSERLGINSGRMDLGIESLNGYKFFYDFNKGSVIKSNNYAVHENVETPKVEKKEVEQSKA